VDRAEAAGFGIAAGGHAALLAALSIGFAATRLPAPRNDPIEVSFVDEVGLESTAPLRAAPAASPPSPAVVPPPQAVPPDRATPEPAPVGLSPRNPPRPAPVPKPRTEPFNLPIPDESDSHDPPTSGNPAAATAGPEVVRSLVAEVRRQVKPHWQRAVPTGADAEALRTVISLNLARDGRITSLEIVGTTGITASNRPQVALHQERAKRAVTLAAPFNLPAQYYDAWKQLDLTLDLRLSQ
jgi:hypothetical protein